MAHQFGREGGGPSKDTGDNKTMLTEPLGKTEIWAGVRELWV